MTQRPQDPRQWCDDIQSRLMAAIDAAWALAESSDDPAVRAKALAKVKLCGQIAATARKVAALSPRDEGPVRSASPLAQALATTAPAQAPATQADLAKAALARVKQRGGRGRL